MLKDANNRNFVPQSSEYEIITTEDYGLSKRTYIGSAELLTDKDGIILPQVFDEETGTFIKLTTDHFSFEEGE